MKTLPDNIKVIWEPIPGSQNVTLALVPYVDDLLCVGTRGSAKSCLQLMAFRRFVGLGYGSHWRGLIYDVAYKDLDSLVAESQRWYYQFDDGAEFYRSKADYRWQWPTGEQLLFRRFRDEEDYLSVHGHQFTFVGANELSKQASPALYDLLLSCMRSGFKPEKHSPDPSNPLPEIPIVRLSTTNPYGPGHNWLKRRYIDPAAYGEIVEHEYMVTPFGKTEPERQVRKQVAMFSSFRENPYLPASYEAQLLSVGDPNKRKAWVLGSWDITSGGIIDDLWRDDVHKIQRFATVPVGWVVDRSFDWGSAHPFSIGWWAVANGEEATMQDGTTWCPRRGSIVRIKEWYGAHEITTNEGLYLASHEIAQGIHEIEAGMLDSGYISKVPRPGPADSEIYNVRDKGTATIAKRMKDYGVEWVPADKSPGSRINGLQLLRDRLSNSIRGEGPGFYAVGQDCPAFLALVVSLPRDKKKPDDADTDAIDHTYDESRYKVLHEPPVYAQIIRVKFPNSA